MTVQSKAITLQSPFASSLVRFLTVVLMVFVVSYPAVSEASSDKVRRPLDLPAGGGPDDEDEDESIPDMISFYGVDYEGDAFVWVLDVSLSMGGVGLIDTLRSEFTGAVSSLSRDTDFGAVAFSTNMRFLDLFCKEADSSRKSTAAAWIVSIEPGGVTCLAPAVVKGLEIVRKSPNQHRRVIVVGDGMPYCGPAGPAPSDVLSDISFNNYDRIPIDTVFVGLAPEGFEFFQQLASQNYGRAVVSQ